jgi:hypothetical protein
MADYAEIEDPKALARLNRDLASKLRIALRHAERRDVGWPAGRFPAQVRFRSGRGSDVFWWTARKSDDGATAVNLFGHGTPGGPTPLNIDVQFNLPTETFARTTGGAFLREKQTGKVLLGHRGIVTLGHGRIPKIALFQEMTCTLRDAETSNGEREFLIIGELAAPSLVEDLVSFATELRRSARALGERPSKISESRTPNRTLRSNGQRGTFGKLRQYFDEFSGKRKPSSRRQLVIADCYHGSVVRAMCESLGSPEKALKSREIDLVILKGTKAFLIEVKTSANTQNIYTAIGQLMVHAPSVAALSGKLKVEKVMVLPQRPSDQLFKRLRDDLNICVLTFTRSKMGRISILGSTDFDEQT